MVYKFLSAAAMTLLCIATAAASPRIDYQNTSIAKITGLVKQNKISCSDLVAQYLDRIRRYDLATSGNKPPINSMIALNPMAMAEAKNIDTHLDQSKNLPLLCVPVVVKDNIDTVDTPSTTGSLSLLGSQPITDAFIVKKLRQAGAIILGKGGMDEFASGTWGINSRLGRTGNPYETTLMPGGSSSGPAAAVNAGFAVIGIGSDNSGSLRIPAAANGLYTIRGGTGTVSQTGFFPRGNLDGMGGPIAQNIEDVAKVMDVIAVKDPNDKKTWANRRPRTYTESLSTDALQGKRIGVITAYADQVVTYDNKQAKPIYQQALKTLQAKGAVIIPNIKLTKFIADRSHNTAGEVKQINAYLRAFPSTREDFRSICYSRRTTLFGDLKKCLAYARENPKPNSKIYRQVLKNFRVNRDYITRVMDKYKLYALLLPISDVGVPNDQFDNHYYTIVSPNAGLPAVEFIAGYTNAKQPLPVGMQFIGRKGDEAKLLGMAYPLSLVVKRQSPVLAKPIGDKSMLSIARFNNFKTRLGNATYQQLIKPKDIKAVTPEAFMKVYRKSLHAASDRPVE